MDGGAHGEGDGWELQMDGGARITVPAAAMRVEFPSAYRLQTLLLTRETLPLAGARVERDGAQLRQPASTATRRPQNHVQHPFRQIHQVRRVYAATATCQSVLERQKAS